MKAMTFFEALGKEISPYLSLNKAHDLNMCDRFFLSVASDELIKKINKFADEIGEACHLTYAVVYRKDGYAHALNEHLGKNFIPSSFIEGPIEVLLSKSTKQIAVWFKDITI